MALVLSGSIDISGSMTATTILISSPGAAGMVSSSAQITELAPLMAYTASLKGAAIVSSSQQVQNYFTFAQTSSANTFFGNQTITGDVTIGAAAAATNRQLIFNGVANKAARIKFQESGVDKWLIGNGSANETGNFEIYNANGQMALSFFSASSAATFIDNIVIGTAGKGIDFSITSNGSGTTTSELLNDYEEGTWTPTATYSGTNTPTHAYQTGHYTKIGRVVQIQALIAWNENGSTGDLTITGLPFTANSTVGRAVTSMMNFGFSGLTTNLVGEVENSSTFIKIRKADNAGTLVTATDTDNDQDLYISCTYMV